MVALHEIMHVLAFSPNLYGRFIDIKGKEIGKENVAKIFTDDFGDRVYGL